MARVIDLKEENIFKCDRCGKYIKYDKSDIKGDYDFGPFGTSHWSYVECPNCGSQMQW